MKHTPSEDELLGRLGASKFSGSGFLGNDHRQVDEIISADLRTLSDLGVELEELVSDLEAVYYKARGGMGAEVEVRPGVTAVYHESMGRIPSPFRGDGVFEKGEAVVVEKESGDSIVLTRLGLALIEKHSFFQGRGSRYRIEPDIVIRMLGLGNGGQ